MVARDSGGGRDEWVKHRDSEGSGTIPYETILMNPYCILTYRIHYTKMNLNINNVLY